MTTSSEIMLHYCPIQPSVKHLGGSIIYSEVLTCSMLRNFIYCYWELKTTEPLSEPFIYRVVADGCIDIFFEINSPIDNYVMGFCNKFTEFPIGKSFHYVGVRFLPTMFSQIFKVSAHELSNRCEKLEFIVPGLSSFIANNFHSQLTQEHIQSLLDRYFVDLLENMNFSYDKRLYNAIDVIIKNFRDVNIAQDLDVGISQRQLRRLFDFYIGDSVKTFAKVVRFQNILRAESSLCNARYNKLFFDAGYYDQSHFINEFKRYYGLTPSKAFGR